MALRLAAVYGVASGAVDPVNNCAFFFFFFGFSFIILALPSLQLAQRHSSPQYRNFP